MKYIIDTNSLLVLVRYYLPLDHNGELRELIIAAFRKGDWVITEQVLNECKQVAGGIVISEFNELADNQFRKLAAIPFNVNISKGLNAKTVTHWLNQLFVRQEIEKAMEAESVEIEKEMFRDSADFSLIVAAFNKKAEGAEVCVMTEESRNSNDSKLYLKIPLMCERTKVRCISIADYLNRHFSIVGSVTTSSEVNEQPRKYGSIF